MQKKYLISIILILGIMFLLRKQSYKTEQKPEVDTNSTLQAQVKMPLSEQQVPHELTEQPPEQTAESTEAMAIVFTEQLRQMNKCFDFQFNFAQPVIEPTSENLIHLFRPFVGEGVIKMEDWAQHDLQKVDGSMIRIRTEMDYEDETNPVRRVQLYDLNSQGMPILRTTDPQQSTNPTENFITSLQGDAKSVSFESGNRVYYQDGEEFVFVEQNGRLNSFTFAKGDKSFSCTMINSSRSNCQCM